MVIIYYGIRLLPTMYHLSSYCLISLILLSFVEYFVRCCKEHLRENKLLLLLLLLLLLNRMSYFIIFLVPTGLSTELEKGTAKGLTTQQKKGIAKGLTTEQKKGIAKGELLSLTSNAPGRILNEVKS